MTVAIVTDDRKQAFLAGAATALDEMLANLRKKPALAVEELDPGRTVLVVVDMVKGFCVKGNLFSPRIGALVPEVERIVRLCLARGIQVICFADSHPECSPEFDAYPEHCRAGSEESELVDELKAAGGCRLFPKNSTNGFLEEEFQRWLRDNPQVDCMIVVGDCTDICVEQFACTAKAYFNMKNARSRIIVPVSAVETFDLGAHVADLMNVVALTMMAGNGVEVVGSIR